MGIIDAAKRFSDGFANVLSGLGGSSDQSTYGHYHVPPISQQQLEASWRVSWLSRKVHRIVPLDCIRAGRSWKAEPGDITLLEQEEKRLGLRLKVLQAMTWARLYGGSAIILGDGGDATQELDLNSIGKGGLKYIHVLTRYELTIPDLIRDPGSEYYGQPSSFLVNGANGTSYPIHPSRVVRFIGEDLPDQLRWQESGWGDPLLRSLQSAIMNADSVQGSFAALVGKAKVDTLTIPGFTELVSTTEGEQRLIKRVQSAQMFESMFHTKIIAGAKTSNEVGENWETRQMNWAGQPEIMMAFLLMVAGAADIPFTRLIGKSADGMNATGEGDTDNYYQMISAKQELELRPRLDMIDEVLIRSALGKRPADVYSLFNPLGIESDAVKAANAKLRADASAVYVTNGLVPDAVMQEAVKSQLIDGGEYPGIERAYGDYEAGQLEPSVEEEELPTEGLLEGDNDNDVRSTARAKLIANGASVGDAYRLTDAQPRTLYVSRKVLNVDDIKAWADKVGIPDLQDDLHCTIMFSRTPVDWLKMGSTWADRDGDGSGKLLITAGGPRVIEPLGGITAVLMFSSTDMQYRNMEMREAGASWDYEDYTCHISLTKSPIDLTDIEPYRGPIEFGPEIFEEIDDGLAAI